MALKKINIGVDGLSATGKDTITKILYYVLNHLPIEDCPEFKVIDSSAMYRAASLFLEKNKVNLGVLPMSSLNRADPMTDLLEKDLERIVGCIENLEMDQDFLEGVRCRYNVGGLEIEDYYPYSELQQVDVGTYAGMLGRIPRVRPIIVEMEREYAKQGYCIVPGRDSFTEVLKDIPEATSIGIYAYADFPIRTMRRFEEVKKKKGNVTYEEIVEALRQRDALDLGRSEAPLPPNPDAARSIGYTPIDSSFLTHYDMGLLAASIALSRLEIDVPAVDIGRLVVDACRHYDISLT